MLDGFPVGDVGAAAILGVAVWLILSGRLVPRSVLEDVRADREIRLAEKQAELEDWKETAKISARQTETLLEQGQTMIQLLRALPHGDGP